MLKMKQLWNRETAKLSIPVLTSSSPLSHLAWYCTQSEVKFDAFICLKCREEILIDKEFSFSFFIRAQHEHYFDQANKKFCHIALSCFPASNLHTMHALHVHQTITCILMLSILSW